MVSETNEQLGGGGSGFGGGNGILGLIALLAIFRGNFMNNGGRDGCETLMQLQTDLGNIRSDIGDTKYSAISGL